MCGSEDASPFSPASQGGFRVRPEPEPFRSLAPVRRQAQGPNEARLNFLGGPPGARSRQLLNSSFSQFSRLQNSQEIDDFQFIANDVSDCYSHL